MYGGGMYGGGLSSMYGGGMYGGGLSPMYGGGMLGGSSMYGGGMLGGSSMYGGGMLGGSSMYGGGMLGGSSMYGGGLDAMGGMANGMAGGYGANGVNGAGTMFGNPGVTNEQGANSLLPPSASDRAQQGMPGKLAIDESPRERRARRRMERRQEKEIAEKQRQQKRQFAIQSTIQVTGHVLQILMQVARSALELFGVGFGTFYSIKALKALMKSQETAAARNAASKATVRSPNDVAAGMDSTTGSSRWKTWLMISALFIAMEALYSMLQRHQQHREDRAIRSSRSRRVRGDVNEIGMTDTDSEIEETISNSEEENEDDTISNTSTDTYSPLIHGEDAGSKRNKRFIAVYDYDSAERSGFIGFKAGDHFVVEEYAENGWCQATLMSADKQILRRGLVPGNFLRPLEGETKL